MLVKGAPESNDVMVSVFYNMFIAFRYIAIIINLIMSSLYCISKTIFRELIRCVEFSNWNAITRIMFVISNWINFETPHIEIGSLDT